MTPHRLYLAILITIAIFGLLACTPPPDLHGRARFDWWIGNNTTTSHEPFAPCDAAGNTSCYDPINRVVHYNDTRIALFDAGWPGMGEWVTIHEQGHAVTIALGLYIHLETVSLPVEPCSLTAGCPSAERAAQCVTSVVLGHGPAWVNDDGGYWSCPDSYVESTRLAMIAGGMW